MIFKGVIANVSVCPNISLYICKVFRWFGYCLGGKDNPLEPRRNTTPVPQIGDRGIKQIKKFKVKRK
jgi:hypothetical protein